MRYKAPKRVNRLEQYKARCNREAARMQLANSFAQTPERVINYAGNLEKRSKYEILLATAIATIGGIFYANRKDNNNCEAKAKTEQIDGAQKNKTVNQPVKSIDDHVEIKKPELRKTDNFERDEIASYIQEQYNKYTKRNLPSETASRYSNWIVKYADMYGVPVDNFLAILHNEHYFVNENGDLNNWKTVNGKKFLDKSEGLCQIGETTQRTIWNMMIKAGEKGLPNKLPDDLRKHPELAIRMSAFYFSYLIDLKEGDVYRAIGCYNGGPGYSNPDYIKKVEEKKRIISQSDIFTNGLSYLKAKEARKRCN